MELTGFILFGLAILGFGLLVSIARQNSDSSEVVQSQPEAPRISDTPKKIEPRVDWKTKSKRWVEYCRYHQDKSAPGWTHTREMVLARAHYTCQHCKKARATAVRLLVWPERWHDVDLENGGYQRHLKALCSDCNKESFEPSDWDDPNHPFQRPAFPSSQRLLELQWSSAPTDTSLGRNQSNMRSPPRPLPRAPAPPKQMDLFNIKKFEKPR
jgi:hypothetical protein